MITTLTHLIKENSELYKKGLPIRTCKALHARGIYKIDTLDEMSYDDLIKIPNIGYKSLKRIDDMFYCEAVDRGEID